MMTLNDADIAEQTARRRRRSSFARRCTGLLVAALVIFGLAASACSTATRTASSQGDRAMPASETPRTLIEETPSADADTVEEAPTAPATVEPTPEPTPTPHPIAVADTELNPAPIGFDSLFENEPAGPQPTSIEIENINVSDAAIIPVGVNPDLTFEVPPADQVGWYEYGSAPGEQGSAVLAAHIAYNGVDGVFRYLEDVQIGSVVVVGFDDGSSQRYRIEEVTEYVKEALPDSLFARDGKEQLALITCGGEFNYQLDSYESNTVAIAIPI